jgi:hypothetical protein
MVDIISVLDITDWHKFSKMWLYMNVASYLARLIRPNLSIAYFTNCFVWLWNLVAHVKRKNADWGRLGTKCWGEYLDLREMKWHKGE